MAPRTRSRAAAEMKLFDLPEELLFKIIELMPSKSLRVARCVNKATEQMAARTPFARACRLLKWARLWDEHDVDISIDEARLEIIARDLARSEEIYHLMRGLGPLPRDLSPAIMPGDHVAGQELQQAELDDQIQRVHPLFFELFAMDWLVIYVPQNVLLRMFCVPQNVLLQPQSLRDTRRSERLAFYAASGGVRCTNAPHPLIGASTGTSSRRGRRTMRSRSGQSRSVPSQMSMGSSLRRPAISCLPWPNRRRPRSSRSWMASWKLSTTLMTMASSPVSST